MGTEVNYAQQDFWLCQCFLSVTALVHVQQTDQLSLCSYEATCRFITENLATPEFTAHTDLHILHAIWCIKKAPDNIPDLHLMMSLNSSLAPPSAMSPCDAMVDN